MKTIFVVMFFTLMSSCTVYNYPGTQPTTTTSTEDPNIPTNISEAIAACKSVQLANDIPITCASDYFQGKPVMAVGFPNAPMATQWAAAVGTYVTVPFCASANKANRQAFLLMMLSKENLGKLYSCESGEESEWFSLDE